jgi:hypothetical protein
MYVCSPGAPGQAESLDSQFSVSLSFFFNSTPSLGLFLLFIHSTPSSRSVGSGTLQSLRKLQEGTRASSAWRAHALPRVPSCPCASALLPAQLLSAGSEASLEEG